MSINSHLCTFGMKIISRLLKPWEPELGSTGTNCICCGCSNIWCKYCIPSLSPTGTTLLSKSLQFIKAICNRPTRCAAKHKCINTREGNILNWLTNYVLVGFDIQYVLVKAKKETWDGLTIQLIWVNICSKFQPPHHVIDWHISVQGWWMALNHHYFFLSFSITCKDPLDLISNPGVEPGTISRRGSSHGSAVNWE